MTNLAYKTEEWYLEEWDYLVDELTNVFRLTKKEHDALNESVTAKIIATIPFAAGCKDPERTAITHLGTYLMELKGFQKFCAHLPSDDEDIFNRLACISTFEGGNKAIIEHGMYMLALIMIEGYKKSMKKDLLENVYNPFNSGKWDYKLLHNKITKKLTYYKCNNLDNLLDYNIQNFIGDW